MRLMMIYTAICMGLAYAMAGAPFAFADARMDRVLLKLEPEERARQACNIRGLDAVRKGAKLKGVDRLKSSSISPATFKGDTVIANGASVRAKHRWYALTFKCTVTADQMRATSFEFKLGDEIPEEKWEDFGLWK